MDGTESMDEPTVSTVVSFPDEVLVELTGEDEAGEIGVVSYQFEYASERQNAVRPKQNLDGHHRTIVEDALDENDYRLVR